MCMRFSLFTVCDVVGSCYICCLSYADSQMRLKCPPHTLDKDLVYIRDTSTLSSDIFMQYSLPVVADRMVINFLFLSFPCILKIYLSVMKSWIRRFSYFFFSVLVLNCKDFNSTFVRKNVWWWRNERDLNSCFSKVWFLHIDP